MNAFYKNWIIRDCQPGGWRRVVTGPSKIETIIVSNSNREVDGVTFQLRLADNAGNTLMMLEPEAVIPKLRSDSFGCTTFTLMRGQHIEILVDNPGLDIMISGTVR